MNSTDGGDANPTKAYICAFCGQPIAIDDVNLRVLIALLPGSTSRQQLYTHLSCLVDRLHESIPLGQALEE